MIAGLSIRNFKGVRSLHASKGYGRPVGPELPLSRFQVLVGPNGVGKTTVLDAIDFVRDCLVLGPGAAVENRGIADFKDLTWMRKGGAVEVELWLDLSADLTAQAESLLQYRIAVRQDPKLGVCVEDEALRQYSRAWLPRAANCDSAPPPNPSGSSVRRPRARTSTRARRAAIRIPLISVWIS